MTAATRLGAIIAGGQARRFGSDKGAALLNGKSLIDHVADALRPQVDRLIIVGREWAGIESVPDAPMPDLGPLGGLNAALTYAKANGFGDVLTAGCDTLPVPMNLCELLNPGPSTIQNHYLFGLWPAALSDLLGAHLANDNNRSMRRWIEVSGARTAAAPDEFFNLNTPENLAAYACRLTSSAEQS